MKSIAIFILFVGTVLIIQGYYENISASTKQETVIKYVPRSLYEEQLSDGENLEKYYKNIFEQTQPR
jgi:hypothetical protein